MTTSSPQIKEGSFQQWYQNIIVPTVGEYYAMVNPSTPVRTEGSKDKPATMQDIETRDDGASLGTVLYFGHPFRVLEVGPGKSSVKVELLTHSDPGPEDPSMLLAFEKHKAQTPISLDEAMHYSTGKVGVVVAESLKVKELITGQYHKLLFGSRLGDVDSTGYFSIGDRKYQVVDPNDVSNPERISRTTTDGLTREVFQRRAERFHGANFMMGMNTTQFSDLSGWIQNLFNSAGINLPHNQLRMLRHLQKANIGYEVTNLRDVQTCDLVFNGNKGDPKSINLLGMIERNPDGRLFMHFVPGAGGGQRDALMLPDGKAEIFSEVQIEGYPKREIKHIWRVIPFD